MTHPTSSFWVSVLVVLPLLDLEVLDDLELDPLDDPDRLVEPDRLDDVLAERLDEVLELELSDPELDLLPEELVLPDCDVEEDVD